MSLNHTTKQEIAIHWFRRDLRLTDNAALSAATNSGLKVLPIFIFDPHILDELSRDDSRVSFIYNELQKIDSNLQKVGSSLKIYHGKPIDIWRKIVDEFHVKKVFFNNDYEPYASERDKEITQFLSSQNIELQTFKDQVIFEKSEITKPNGLPYTVFTPFMKKWKEMFLSGIHDQDFEVKMSAFLQKNYPFQKLEDIGFKESTIKVKPFNLNQLDDYSELRNLPAEDGTSYLSPHLRFGTVSIRNLMRMIGNRHESFRNELIWREFFMQILYHFPHVANENFKPQYNGIQWRNNAEEFERWCTGQTGFPIVDAGMRQLVSTGYMHNRVRMIVASFLTKDLLIDWRWGEAFFAKHLLDFDLASNNGNWQWAAGTGCDATPYFRVFNPDEQTKRFDPNLTYTRKWVTEMDEFSYPKPMVDHKFARNRALETYKKGILKM